MVDSHLSSSSSSIASTAFILRLLVYLMLLLRRFSSSFATASIVEKSLQYRIRQATVEDIHAIQQCNLITLPENYDYDFFHRHITSFPDLAFVAENDNETVQATNHRQLFGYTLGKLEYPAYRDDYDSKRRTLVPGFEGHVTSIAVYEDYRGHGIAKKLLDSLHHHFAVNHRVDMVSLKCRVTNTAALKLYTECYPYRCAKRLPAYYQDDEDAWHLSLTGLQQLIKSKNLESTSTSQSLSKQ
jgi:N-alpha-acetyltransferase 10/11